MRVYTRIGLAIASGVLMVGLAAASAVGAAGHKAAAGVVRGQHKSAGFAAFVKSLNLTKDQRVQIKPILKAARAEVKAVRANTTLSATERRKQVRAIVKTTMGQIRPILNADQQAKVDAFVQRLKDLKAGARTKIKSNKV